MYQIGYGRWDLEPGLWRTPGDNGSCGNSVGVGLMFFAIGSLSY